jgi:hypothetical protein
VPGNLPSSLIIHEHFAQLSSTQLQLRRFPQKHAKPDTRAFPRCFKAPTYQGQDSDSPSCHLTPSSLFPHHPKTPPLRWSIPSLCLTPTTLRRNPPQALLPRFHRENRTLPSWVLPASTLRIIRNPSGFALARPTPMRIPPPLRRGGCISPIPDGPGYLRS